MDVVLAVSFCWPCKPTQPCFTPFDPRPNETPQHSRRPGVFFTAGRISDPGYGSLTLASVMIPAQAQKAVLVPFLRDFSGGVFGVQNGDPSSKARKTGSPLAQRKASLKSKIRFGFREYPFLVTVRKCNATRGIIGGGDRGGDRDRKSRQTDDINTHGFDQEARIACNNQIS